MDSYILDWKEYAALARQTVAEGCVLLRNENAALPLMPGDTVAVFGRIQLDYYRSGTGSGGMVNVPYVHSILDGLREYETQDIKIYEPLLAAYQAWTKEHPFDHGNGWGQEPWCQAEMPLSEALVEDVAAHANAALVILGRTAGEDRDNSGQPGSYYLTDTELDMLRKVCAAFSRTTVVLNTGNIISMNWVDEVRPGAVLYAWQGGMEGGMGVADVLCGAVSPSGRLSDTIARELDDYPSTKNFGSDTANFYQEDIYVGYRYFETFAPEKVAYPFGFGLSYTTFATEYSVSVNLEAILASSGSELSVNARPPECRPQKCGVNAPSDPDFREYSVGNSGVNLCMSSDENSGVNLCMNFAEISDAHFTLSATVTNTGGRPGKEVVQVYVCPPQGTLGKPLRNLCAFEKTNELCPGEAQTLSMTVALSDLASYDDSGASGHRSCYVLEAGSYFIYAGANVRDAKLAGSFFLPETIVTSRCSEAMAPVVPFERFRPTQTPVQAAHSSQLLPQCSPLALAYEPVPLRTAAPAERRLAQLPECRPCTGDKGYLLSDVMDGSVSMDDFLAQLSDDDLMAMSRGEGMCSPKVTPGTAAAFGGVTDSLLKFGIPTACCSDGPSGIRMDCGTSAFSLPNGTLLACTFNTALVTELFAMEGLELYANKIDSLLGPGINIHRSPLNGRNFEYHSEDPYLTGRMAAAQVTGMDRYGVSGTMKHFCANNQEFRRHSAISVVSERALREIYLKPFEMGVRCGHTRSIMTTYGPVNGIWTAGNYDLNTTILRGEWHYQGLVMTDWWAKINDEGQDASLTNLAAMVRAQNDVYMVTQNAESYKDNQAQALSDGALTRAELVRNAANICRFLINSPAMQRRSNAKRSPIDRRDLPSPGSIPALRAGYSPSQISGDGAFRQRSLDPWREVIH
ncbi:MAG: glycoside hydrolase family 3 C-terminal domain-containing protein [Lachnospiraceae bacterium]|nr:glycoside hydrolase family 3 C-terminal domain-containing protein [Lachnospiraceae bacterium]